MIKQLENKKVLYGILFSMAFALYLPTIQHQYAWDDTIAITGNPITTKGIQGIPEIWTQKSFIEDRPIYRPVPQTLFALEWSLAKNNPHVGHFFNVLFYSLTVVVLMLLLGRIFPNISTYLLLFMGLLFALHPVHVEVVANIKSRDEILAAGFALLSLFFAAHQIQDSLNFKKWGLALLFIVLGSLSKISALTVSPFIVGLFVFFNQSLIFHFFKSSLNWIVQNKWRLLHAFALILFILVYRYYLSDIKSLLLLLGLLLFYLVDIKNNLYNNFLFLAIAFISLFIESTSIFGVFSLYFFYLIFKEAFTLKNLISPSLILIGTLLLGVFLLGNKWYFLPAFLLLQVILFLSLLDKKLLRKGFLFLHFICLLASIYLFVIISPIYSALIAAFSLLFIISIANYPFGIGHFFKNYLKQIFVFFILFIYVSNQFEGLIENYTEAQIYLEEDAARLAALPIEGSRFLENQPYHNIFVVAENFSEKLATSARIQLIYLQKLFFPHHLVHQHGVWQVRLASFNDWDVWLSIFIHILLIVFVFKRIKQKCPIAFGVLFYLVTISIYSNLFYLMPDTLAERFLFLPSVGFVVAFVFALNKIFEKASKEKSIAVVGVLLIPFFLFFTYKTLGRSKDWKDNFTLSANTLPYAENNATINGQYAAELRKKLFSESENLNKEETINLIEKHFKKALEIYPDFYSVLSDLGVFYIELQEPDNAFPLLRKATEINPKKWINHYYLGLIYYDRKQFVNAEKHLQKVVELNNKEITASELINTYEYWGRALFNQNKVKKANEILKEAYEKYNSKETKILWANMNAQKGNIQEAIDLYTELQQLFPEDSSIQSTIEYLRRFK